MGSLRFGVALLRKALGNLRFGLLLIPERTARSVPTAHHSKGQPGW